MDMGAVIASFDDAFEAAIASLRNEPEDPEASGLVQQQRYFMKLHKK